MGAELWTDDYLQGMRQHADPYADGIVARLFDEHGIDAFGRFYGQILHNDGVPVEGLPTYIADYLRETLQPPAWLDRDLAERAAQVLASHGMLAFAILGCASLPECYVDRPGVPVLWLTQQMNTHVHRRTVETTQFVLGVMAKGGMEANGRGLRAAQKVRLMHAAIRHLILATPDAQLAAGLSSDMARTFLMHQWQHDLGLPVNQEDQAYTLQTFAWVTVRGLRDLGCELSADEEEGIVHVWNAAGHAMGIRDELLPASVAEAEILFSRIKAKNAAPSDGARSMQAALLRYSEATLPSFPPGISHMPRLLTRYLVGDETADMLGIPRPGVIEREEFKVAIAAMRAGDHLGEGVFDCFSPMRKAADLMFRSLMDHYLALPPNWQRRLFEVPDHLAREWKVIPAL